MTTRFRLLSATALYALVLPILYGQAGTEGSFFGTVMDTSGAIVPGAAIEVSNLATGFQQSVTADSEGNFNLLSLPIGSYSISVSAPGFKKWSLAHTELNVGDRNRLSPVLEVGQVTETVNVQASAELLETEKGTLSSVVQMQQIRELPLATRNTLSLVATVPGMRIDSTQAAGERSTYVQGMGRRNNVTNFQLDGVDTNAPMDEGGTGIPNVDTIAEFSVQTNSFSAELGRDPMQVLLVTKSGTNEFHASIWEFVQNNFFNARNTFSATSNQVRYNQFGNAGGGPIIRNKTFFFTTFQSTLMSNASVYNSQAVTPAMEAGNFSGLTKTIKNPFAGGAPFAGNVIPASMIDSASKYFLPLFLQANSPGGFYRANASSSNDTYEGMIRVDHQITAAQRIYGRYVRVDQPLTVLGYKPDPSITGNDEVNQHSLAINYTWTVSPNTILVASGGILRTNETYTNPYLGKQNLSMAAGIQGIPSYSGFVGPPDISLASGYTGISFPGGFGVPGSLWGDVRNGKVSVTHIRGSHTVAAGFEYGDWHNFGKHGSDAVRGAFTFGNLYTNDGFADYLLGLMSQSERNAPSFGGVVSSPYYAAYLQDSWRIRPNFSVDLGLRLEHWGGRRNLNDESSTWDPKLNKMVAAVDHDGNVNLSDPNETPGLAAATNNLWVTARQAGYPDGLYNGPSEVAPRIGGVYRPMRTKGFVIRGGYGMFFSKFTGNRASSTKNVPFWTREYVYEGLTQLEPWETAWAGTGFQPFTVYAPDVDVRPVRDHEWNISAQTALPFKSALTVSYVGSRAFGEFAINNYNVPTVGFHPDLQAARPFPAFGDINLYQNLGRSWYNSLQTKVERRFALGLSFTFSYALSRSMALDAPDCETCALLAYSPDWYNRGRQSFDFHQIESATMVWELPVGHGKKYFSSMNRVLDAVVGGWELSMFQQARSGAPLSISDGVNNLGNNQGSRANVVANPGLVNPSPAKWFNTAAFAATPLYSFGNAGLGNVDGPGFFTLDTTLSKRFYVTEKRYFQLRGEAYNVTNRANYNSPNATLTSSSFGRITSALSARYMQLGMKFVF